VVAVLAATGALSAQVLGLKVQVYDPVVYCQQVRDAWVGVRNARWALTLCPLMGRRYPMSLF
jgi:hypothetical protein